MTSNPSITPQVRPAVLKLDQFARRPDVVAAVNSACAEARARLHSKPDVADAFVEIELSRFGTAVPDTVGSLRVVMTRGAGGASVERHSNSTQYLLALDGPVQTHVQVGDTWRVDLYGHGLDAAEDRWHVTAPGIWHKTQAPGLQLWGIVAFHSAAEVHDEYR